MPPRYAYWTILIDNKPTAFRAREREELLPTFHQLQRKNANVVMQWFARGRLWETQQAERDDFQRRKYAGAPAFRPKPAPRAGSDVAAPPPSDHEGARSEKRSRDWRPGGDHKDPRDRFKKKNRSDRTSPATSASSKQAERSEHGGERKPWRDKPAGPPRGDRPWTNKPPGDRPRGDRPWANKPPGDRPRGDRPWTNKPPSDRPRGDRPWSGKPKGGTSQPWRDRPHGGKPQPRAREDSHPPDRQDTDLPPKDKGPGTDKEP